MTTAKKPTATSSTPVDPQPDDEATEETEPAAAYDVTQLVLTDGDAYGFIVATREIEAVTNAKGETTEPASEELTVALLGGGIVNLTLDQITPVEG